MTRHDSTKGNDLQPNRVDASKDVTVAGGSVADAAAGFFIGDTKPMDPLDGARWTDTADTPPRTFVFDDSTSAWIPINAGDRTFVSDTEPEDLLKGDIWFDTSHEHRTEIFWFNGDALVFLQSLNEIPDSVVDNFEDLYDGPYEEVDDLSTFYSTESGGAERQSGLVSEGDYAARGDGSDNTYIWSMPDDGLPYYPEWGDDFTVELATDGGRAGFIFFSEGPTIDADCWRVRIQDDPTSGIRLYSPDGDENRIEFNPSSGFYTMEISTTEDGDVTLDTSEGGTSINNQKTDGNGIGWYFRGTGAGDNARLVE